MRIAHPRTGVVVETDPFEPPAGTKPDGPTNANALRSLWKARPLYWRGRTYLVPPISYRAAIELNHAGTEAARTSKAMNDAVAEAREWDVALAERYREALDRCADLFRTMVRPYRLRHRLLWPLARNPFRDATEVEVAELLDFFSTCRTNGAARQASTN